MIYCQRKEAAMFKAGWVMLVFSVLLACGKQENKEDIIAIICAVLFIVGLVMMVISENFGL